MQNLSSSRAIQLPHVEPSGNQRDVEPREIRSHHAAQQDPLRLDPASLTALERELGADKPCAQSLCRAADVLLIEGRSHDAVAMLFWGMLKYPEHGETQADHLLLKTRHANALLHTRPAAAGDRPGADMFDKFTPYEEAIKTLDGPRDVEGQGVYLMAWAMRLRAMPHGPERTGLLDTISGAFAAGLQDCPDEVRDSRSNFLAIFEHLKGDREAAMAQLREVRGAVNRMNACIAMGRLDDAFNLIDQALDRGNAALLARIWRSPSVRELAAHPRFDSIVARSGSENLRRGNVRLTVPDAMLYGGMLSAKTRLMLRKEREHVFDLQAKLDKRTEKPYDLFEVAETLERNGNLRDAENVLRWAIHICPEGGERDNLKTRLAGVYLESGNSRAAHNISAYLSQSGQNQYHTLLASFMFNGTKEQMRKLAAEIDTALDDDAAYAASPSGDFDRDRLKAIKTAVLLAVCSDDEMEATLAAGLEDIRNPVARAIALRLAGKNEQALGVLLAMDQTDDMNRVWNCPMLPELQGEPGWKALLVNTAAVELASGDLKLRLPERLLASAPAVDAAPGRQPRYGVRQDADGFTTLDHGRLGEVRFRFSVVGD